MSSIDCDILKMKEEDREEDQHHMIRRKHPSLKRQDDLRSEDRDKSVHSHIQPALGLDVSLHGGIPPGRPLIGR